MFSNAPFGKNLESACKAYAAREAARKEREAEAAYLKKMADAWDAYLDEKAEPRETR